MRRVAPTPAFFYLRLHTPSPVETQEAAATHGHGSTAREKQEQNQQSHHSILPELKKRAWGLSSRELQLVLHESLERRLGLPRTEYPRVLECLHQRSGVLRESEPPRPLLDHVEALELGD